MIPALRLVPPGHTLVTLGERFFGGLTLYYDRAPRGAPYFPRILIRTFRDFSLSSDLISQVLFFSGDHVKSSQLRVALHKGDNFQY
jgi:hypothetical protein